MFDGPILDYELWAGERDVDVRVIENRMKVTRKPHLCCVCFEEIATGARCRVQSEVNRDDNRTGTFYVCPQCCEAIRTRKDDGGGELQRRWELGYANSLQATASQPDRVRARQ